MHATYFDYFHSCYSPSALIPISKSLPSFLFPLPASFFIYGSYKRKCAVFNFLTLVYFFHAMVSNSVHFPANDMILFFFIGHLYLSF